MAFGWAGAAAGAGDALQEMLATRRAEFLQQEQLQLQQAAAERAQAAQQQQAEQFSQRMAFDTARAGEDQQYRQTQMDRQATGDRQAENQTGVRRMIGEFLTQRGAQPLDTASRNQLSGMAIGEGVDLPASVMEDPGADLANYEAKRKIDLKYRPPTASGGAAPSNLTLQSPDGKQQQRVPDGAQANALLQQGWKLFDPVAARSSQPLNSTEAVDTAREVQRIARTLRSHPGVKSAFGVLDSRLPTFSQDTANAEELLKSLSGLLTLENMGKMKGVLSDKDMQVLQQASSTLGGGRIGDAAALAELQRLDDTMSTVTGGGAPRTAISVKDPSGRIHEFATPEEAKRFKQLAGIQ